MEELDNHGTIILNWSNNILVDPHLSVIRYVIEEVERQGHNTQVLDGIERVGWMLSAWSLALSRSEKQKKPCLDDALALGRRVEAHKNFYGIRDCGVTVGGAVCPRPEKINGLLVDLFAQVEVLSPLEFYKAFLEIHPFEDGNGRTGKIILNWCNDTLDAPVFPPNNLWGREIRNP